MTIFSWQNIYQAYCDCRKSKRGTANALKFEWALERNIFSLQKELIMRTYSPGRSICFVVTEPKPREIFAADFRDRIVYHLLINQLEKIGERIFVFDSFACRPEKGTHLTIRRLRKFVGSVTQNYQQKAFYAQLDVSGFFMNINHQILYQILKEEIIKQPQSHQWKEEILWLSKIIIFSRPIENYLWKGNPYLPQLIPPRKSLFYAGPNHGLPIGNYSSQFFANLYLNQLDQYVKRTLKAKYYLRYVDDFILLHRNKKQLESWTKQINQFLQKELTLELNPTKTKILDLHRGIDFLGYFIKPTFLTVRQSVVKRLKEKLFCFDRELKINNTRGKKIEKERLNKMLATINSYYGHFCHADSYHLRRSLYQDHFGLLKRYLQPADRGFTHFKISGSTS
jgi:RNA-directed DNA polymerase